MRRDETLDKKIIRLRAKGLTNEAIAEQLGKSKSNIDQRVVRLGKEGKLELRQRGWQEGVRRKASVELEKTVIRLYKQGLTWPEIANQTGNAESTVKNIGTRLRKRGQLV